jgi:hypothetical protein
VKNVGPGFTEFINKEVQTEEDALRNIRQKEIDFCKASIAGEQAAQVPTRFLADSNYVLSCCVLSPDPHGLLNFAPLDPIRISLRNADPDPGTRASTKINK